MLKVGLIVDSTHVPLYVRDLVLWAQTRSDIDISHLVVQTLPPRSNLFSYYLRRLQQRGFLSLLAAQTFRWLLACEHRLLARNPVYRGHLVGYDIEQQVAGRLDIQARVSPSGFVYRFDERDVVAVRDLGLDVLIRCGSGILRGDILSAARLGILSFHHADNRVNRGGPAGFWEVYLKSPETGVTVQRLTEVLDGGEVLARGAYPTKSYFLLNQAFIYLRGNALMQRLLATAAETGRLPEPEPALPYCHPLYRLPQVSVQFAYALAVLGRFARTVLRHLSGAPHENWKVAYQHAPWRSAVFWKARTIPNPAGCFLADPFPVEHEGRNYIFAEEYSYKKRIGRISAYAVTESGCTRLGLALSEAFHLSFPYVFRYNGVLYMCPETSAIKEIRLYRCVDFPLRWEHCATLMQGVSAADTVIFEKEGCWWMLTNIDSSGLGDHSSELHVFCADSPLSPEWKPCASGPVIDSPLCARNGGLLVDSSGIFRVAQKQGFNVYGEAASVRRVVHLAEDGYAEALELDIDLHIDGKKRDCHHLASNARITVFDYK